MTNMLKLTILLGTLSMSSISMVANAGDSGGGCEPKIKSSSFDPTVPGATTVSGSCLDLASQTGYYKGNPSFTIDPEVKAWVDGDWVTLVKDAPINSYTLDGSNNLATVSVCSNNVVNQTGMTELSVKRPYTYTKYSTTYVGSKTEEEEVAVIFFDCTPE